jgi:hypothetical protein
MRIAYSNIVDDLDASHLSAYSTATNYPLANVQDQRLSTRWKSDTSATAQTVTVELDTFPEYPDGTAGTVYSSNFATSVDSWIASGTASSAVNSDGNLRCTKTAASTFWYRTVAVSAQTSIMLKLRLVSGLPDASTLTVAASGVTAPIINASAFDTSGAWNYYTATNGVTAGTNLQIWLGSLTSAASYIIDIGKVYVGNGTYTTTLPDISGNGNHGTVYGAIPTEGVSGRALIFDGVNDYISFIPVTGSIRSYSVWFKHPATRTGNEAFISNNRSLLRLTATAIQYIPDVDLGGILSYAWASDANWHHLVVIQSGTSATMYLDDVSVTSGTVDAIDDTYVIGSIGRYVVSAGAYLNGTIDSSRIYNRALSDSEVEHLYNREPFVGEYDGLAGYWKPDDGLCVNTVAIMGHNILPGTQVKIQANNSDNWGDPEVDEVLTVNRDTILKFLTSTATYKYWRFYFYGQGSIEAGRLWLGEYETIDPSSLVDFKVSKKRSDIVSYGKDRQKYATPGYSWRRIELSFPPTEETMIKRVSDLYDAVGNHSSLIFCNFDTIRDYQLVEPMYCSIDGEVGFDYGKRMLATYSLNIEEDR